MSFSDLPLEVLDSIVQTLAADGKLAQYASISSPFQGVVEQRLFSSLDLSSLDLEDFSATIERHPHRKAALRNITFAVVLPTYTDKECSWFETDSDKTANNEAFTAAVSHLFRILSSCDDADRSRPISLFLGRVYSPMDMSQRKPEKLAADKLAHVTSQRHDLFQHRYEHSYIQLLHPESVPAVLRVKTINICTETSRCLAPATAANISSKLTGVETIEWNLFDAERKYRDLRISLRQEFTQALKSLRCEHAKSLKLNLAHGPPSNQGYTSFDIRLEDSKPVDGFSAQLGEFLRMSNLVKINLGGPICIGPEIFRVVKQEGLSWACLQEFFVTISPVRPDGGWYFDRGATDPGGDDEEEDNDDDEAEYVRMAAWHGRDVDADTESSSSGYDSDESFFEDTDRPPDRYNESRERYRQGMSPVRSFRTIPSPSLEELLQAAAEATPHMPALRTFSVGAGVEPSARTKFDPQMFEFVFAAAGYDNWMDQEVDDQNHRRLTWVTPREWKPSQRLAETWQKVLGDDGLVRYQQW